MKNLLSLLFFFYATSAQSQFYYNDIIGTEELNQRMKNYTANKVASVNAIGFDAEGIKNTDFIELQEVKENGRLLKISSYAEKVKSTIYYRFNETGKLASQTDSANGAKSVTAYQYDKNGKIISVFNTVSNIDNDVKIYEEHKWIYNTTGQPEKMWKIMNGKDSTLYQFSMDERNNIADEILIRKGIRFDSVLFYYDAQNRLSDIVRYNKKAGKLLPDFMFEYDGNNQVIQKISTVSDTRIAYIIWRFQFNEKGLKTKEVLFNRYKQQTGRIEYRYTFGS